MCVWLALAVLGASWLWGVSYYYPAQPSMWLIALAATLGLLMTAPGRMPSRATATWAALLLLPALVLTFWLPASWPCRAALVLLVVGLLAAIFRRHKRDPGLFFPGQLRLVTACMLSGALLLVQALGLLAYESLTARCHDLPDFLGTVVAAVAWLLGIQAARFEDTLAILSMREVHLFGLTWELLLDPATLLFLLGGAVLILWEPGSPRNPGGGERALGEEAFPRRAGWRRLWGLLVLAAAAAAWLPLRAGLLLALFLHDVLRLEYEAPMRSMGLMWSPWVHLLLLLPLALLAWWLVPMNRPAAGPPQPGPTTLPPPRKKRTEAACWGMALGLTALAAAAFTFAVVWEPVGRRAAGRVLVEEYCPPGGQVWERTDKPFDTEWYGQESGYNYYCIADYSSRFYQVSRLTVPITPQTLADCDVLVIKVPMRSYATEEIESIERFVSGGGGLLLVGEHTNFSGSSAFLNAIAERFGFRFRYDCLFGMDVFYQQRYEPPLVPHPVVQRVPLLDFAVSCSLAPGRSAGRAVIRGTGLKSLPADYHAFNYYPQFADRAEMRYGAFIQLWATRHGRGRVLAFTDSTIFSNFSAFEPGKAELWLGMLEWLNHRPLWPEPRWWLVGLGGALLGGAGLARRWSRLAASEDFWWLLVAAGVLGWSTAVVAARELHRAAMPLPTAVRPFVQVVIDRTVSDVLLPQSGFIGGAENGYGLFERWILRLGYFTARRGEPRPHGQPSEFAADLLVVIRPTRPPTEKFLRRLVEYVNAGGKLLLLDSPDNTGSTANILLEPFGLRIEHGRAIEGLLASDGNLPAVPLHKAAVVRGGKAFCWVGHSPVGTVARHGGGLVVALGLADSFSDARMGATGDVEPDAPLRRLYQLQFDLLRGIMEGDADLRRR
jgi:hypothetical protein